jgi:hypothetical protein
MTRPTKNKRQEESELEIGQPNDSFEQEADQVAEQVVNTTTAPSVRMMANETGDDKVQMMGNEDDDESIQMMGNEEDEKVQMDTNSDAESGNRFASEDLTQNIQNTKGSGAQLPSETQQEIGGKMGADFSDVNVHTDDNAVEMNKELGAKAFTHGKDIYFNEGQYNPNSQDGKRLLAHELTHTEQQSTGQIQPKIQAEFDPNTATTRIAANDKFSSFPLRKKNGLKVRYESDEPFKGGISLPAGAEVVKLDKKNERSRYTHVIAWYRGKYREGYIDSSAFDNKVSEDNPQATEVFINDAYFTLARAENKIEKDEKKGKTDNYESVIKGVKGDLEDYENGVLKIDNGILKKVKEASTFSRENKAETIQKISTAVHNEHNPKRDIGDQKGVEHNKETLVIPLSEQWFKSNEELKAYYEAWVLRHPDINRFWGSSGEILNYNLEGVKEALVELDIFLQSFGWVNVTEVDWVHAIIQQDFTQFSEAVFIHEGTWDFGGEDKYASGIALENSYGPLRMDPVMTVMVHEFSNYHVQDTHIDQKQSKAAWDTANQGKFDEEIKDDPGSVDALFQSNAYLSIMGLAYFMSEIKKNQ